MLPFLKVVLIALLYKSPKCLLSPGLFWYDHSLPFAGRIARSASALIELFTEAFSFSFVFVVVAVSCAICLNCSVLLSIASLSVGGVWVWSNSSFLPVFYCGTFFCPSFLGLTFPPWWLLLAFPWAFRALRSWFPLAQFWHNVWSRPLIPKGVMWLDIFLLSCIS